MAKKEKPPLVHSDNCIFCGGSPLTDEHMFPKWLRDYFPRYHKRTDHFVVPPRPTDASPKPTVGRLHSKRSPVDGTLRVVCAPCNNDWMNQTTLAARPALLDLAEGQTSKRPTTSECRSLARWATLFTMVVEFAAPEIRTISVSERHEFKTTTMPPPNWLIFGARYHGTSLHGGFWHRAGGIPLLLDLPELPDMGRLTMTFCVGKMLFHVVRYPPGMSVDAFDTARRFSLFPLFPVPSIFHDIAVGTFSDLAITHLILEYGKLMGFRSDAEYLKSLNDPRFRPWPFT